ncbi:MAG: RHS repeat protein [Deltaproteobacteria bacterium]|nr:RHS repeat protein [Deltaproteobacteria bacterium]
MKLQGVGVAKERVFPGPCKIVDIEKGTQRTFEYNDRELVSKMTGDGFEVTLAYDDKGNVLKKKIMNRRLDATYYYSWDAYNNLINIRYVPSDNPSKTLRYHAKLNYDGTPGPSDVVYSVDFDQRGFPNAHYFETRFNIALLSLDAEISVEKKIKFNDKQQPIAIDVMSTDNGGVPGEPTHTKIEYSELGRIKKIEQTNSMFKEHPDIREMQYDANNRLKRIVDSTWFDGQYYQKKIEYSYDSAGNAVSVREFEEGNTIRFEKYDYDCWVK